MTARYRVLLQPVAQRDLRKITGRSYERLGKAILALADAPRPPHVRKLAGGLTGYRVACGDWRVLYEVDDAARVVSVWRVAHRRESYR